MRVLILGAAMTAAAFGAGHAMQAPAVQSSSTLEVVVANQQSASASLLQADGTMKHVQVGDGPHEAAVSPDGRIAVVTIYGVGGAPGNQLAVIDLERDVVTRRIDLGQYTRPHGVVFLASSSDRVAVTSETTSNVVLVTLSTGAVEAIGTNARGSHMIAVTADGTRGWTANVADNSVSEIDLAGRRFVRSFSVPAQPEGITVTPDGAFVWVGSNQTGAVTVISTESGQIATTLNGASFPYRLGAARDGSRIAIVDGRGNKLIVADARTRAVAGEIPLTSPRGVSFSPDNQRAWVTLADSQVVEVDVQELKVLRTGAVQTSPDGVGVGVRR
jgi:DNA-binding beta-propeller fold protein YncE